MKNVKFGAFSLGLFLVVGSLVTSVNAQTWVPFDFAQDRQAEPGRRVERPNLMVLDGRGSQLGVMVSDLDIKATTGGVQIDEVNADSPAEKAGIKAGDVVVEYDGERVRSARQFTRLVQETPEGRSVAIALLRDGKRQTVNATPDSGRMTWNFGPEIDRAFREAERGMREFRFDGPGFNYRFDNPDNREPRRFEYRVPDGALQYYSGSRGRLGVTVQPLTRDLEEYFGAKNGGALVSSVTPESAASKAGVKAGDVIVSVNGRSVADAGDLARELADINGDVTIVVLRDKKEMTLKATIEQRPRVSVPRAGSRPGVIL
jgi:S1-C subfamily serine protease